NAPAHDGWLSQSQPAIARQLTHGASPCRAGAGAGSTFPLASRSKHRSAALGNGDGASSLGAYPVSGSHASTCSIAARSVSRTTGSGASQDDGNWFARYSPSISATSPAAFAQNSARAPGSGTL